MNDHRARFDDEERAVRSGPRTVVVLAVTLAAVVLLGAVAVGVARWMDRSDAEEAVPATTADAGIDVEPVGGASANRLFARRTDSGIDIRVHETDDPMFGGMPQPPDDAPAECRMRAMAMATVVAPDAVAQAQLPLAEEVSSDSAVSPLIGGQIEGAPLYGVLAQVGADVMTARMTVIGGGQDAMEPIDGVIALAVAATPDPGSDDGDGDDPGRGFEDPWGQAMRSISLELLHADGSTERVTGNDLMQGRHQPRIWTDTCANAGQGFPLESIVPVSTVPLTVPDPSGPQPEDPAGARAQIEQAFAEVHADIGNFETLLRTIDDPSGIDLLVADAPAPVERRLRAITVEITDVVFFSPVEASFSYRATIPDQAPPVQWYGRARLVEGSWRITRSTICQELEQAGVVCQV